MKRFKFTLETVANYKKTVEKSRKADLSDAQNELRRLEAIRLDLEGIFNRNTEQRQQAIEENTSDTAELIRYDVFFKYLREEIDKVNEEIKKAEAHRDKCMELVIEVMKEVKVFQNLKEEEYLQYREEVRIEEEKEISGIVSFRTVNPDMV